MHVVYDNPFRRSGTRKTRRGYFGGSDGPSPATLAATSAETVDQNSAVLSASIPFDELPLQSLDSFVAASV